jgi:hypothetical protein
MRPRSPSLAVLFACLAAAAVAADPCVSGLPPGQRPGPYSALVAVGPQRGQPHCFICETGDRPAVIVFARNADDRLGRLAVALDQAVADNQAAGLRAWVTFLHADQAAFDPQVVRWARQHGLRNLPLAVFEDLDGPPSYKLNRDADVTVLLAVNQKVVANFAFRSGELTEERVRAVLAALPRILPPPSPPQPKP